MTDQQKPIFDLAEKSFLSVMVYGYQHEENKASRMLTAIAFITAAAASIFSKIYISDKTQQTLQVFGINYMVICFSLYILFVLLGVLCCLIVLDPALNLPQSFAKSNNQAASFLFYKLIAEGGLEKWLSLWKDKADEISDSFIENYKNETFLLAQTSMIKYKSIRLGGLFLRFAILFLLYLVAALFVPDLLLIKVFFIASTLLFFVYLVIERGYLRASTHVNRIWYYVLAIAALHIIFIISTQFKIV